MSYVRSSDKFGTHRRSRILLLHGAHYEARGVTVKRFTRTEAINLPQYAAQFKGIDQPQIVSYSNTTATMERLFSAPCVLIYPARRSGTYCSTAAAGSPLSNSAQASLAALCASPFSMSEKSGWFSENLRTYSPYCIEQQAWRHGLIPSHNVIGEATADCRNARSIVV